MTDDPLYQRLRNAALAALDSEPLFASLLRRTVLHPTVSTFEGAVAMAIYDRFAEACGPDPSVSLADLRDIFVRALSSDELELGHPASHSVAQDALACLDRDPACDSLLEPLLFFKGYAALVCHRVARRAWTGKKRLAALYLQSRASAAFGVDIHPGASIGAGVMIDHATGVVIGETAHVGDGCTLLHGCTLGGTGKDAGDRHPKIGKNALIGANASVLGNIKLGDCSKIGAGSVVLRPVPHGATAVGSPAKVIGWAKETNPAACIDNSLKDVMTMNDGAGSENELSLAESTASLTVSGSGMSLDDTDDEEEEGGDTTEDEEPASGSDEEGSRSPQVEKGNHGLPENQRNEKVTAETTRSLEEEGKVASPLPPSSKRKSIAAAARGSRRRVSVQIPRSVLANTDDFSPFRSFKLRCAPPGCITYCTLNALLSGEGCTDEEIGEVFFELLRRTGHPERKYIPGGVFRDEFEDVAREFCKGMNEDRCRRIAGGGAGSKGFGGGRGSRLGRGSCSRSDEGSLTGSVHVMAAAANGRGMRGDSLKASKQKYQSMMTIGVAPNRGGGMLERQGSLGEDLMEQVVSTAVLASSSHHSRRIDEGSDED